MKEYQKIRTLWAREDEKPHNMIVGRFDQPEFELLADIEWTFTEKVDGTNIRVMWDGHKVAFGGKTDNAQIPAKLYERLQELFGGENNEQVFESQFGSDPVCLYGEGFGGNIQGLSEYGDFEFVLFDVKVGEWWLNRDSVEEIANRFDMEIVPVVGKGTLEEMSQIVADGFSSWKGDFTCEGLVARPTVELKDRKGKRIITKLKHNDFLKLSIREHERT